VEKNETKYVTVFRMALSVWIACLASGCQDRLTKEMRTGINSVRVNTEVSRPDVMVYGPREGPSTLLGVAVSLVHSYSEERKTIEGVMRDEDIDPARILVTHFKEQLEAAKIFPSVVETDADASFRFRIQRYGLQTSDDAAGWPPYPHRAVFAVHVELTKSDGTLVWRNYASTIWGKSEVDAYKDDEYIENPGLLRKGFEQAAGEIVRDLIKKMRK
jgi:hypothetical protein